MGEFPKSKSGPTSSGQFGPGRAPQPTTKTSDGVTCDDHTIFPVPRSNAMTASLVVCCGSVYMLPVAAYRRRRFASTVGDAQMPAPAGPQRVAPAAFLPIGIGVSGIV